MNHITLHKTWIIDAPIEKVFELMTDFEKYPEHFPKVAQVIQINKREGDFLEMEATVKSFGKLFKVKMNTQILPGKGFISDNDSYQFGTSGHEELLLSESVAASDSHVQGKDLLDSQIKNQAATLIDYTYEVTIHKALIRIFAIPLLRWYSMKFWEKAVIDRVRELLER